MVLVSTIIYPIYKDRSLLLIKEASINTKSCKVLISSLMNFKPLFIFLIYQLNHLLRLFILFLGTASRTPPKRYAYTPQLIHIHPPQNRLRSFLFTLERHVCLTYLYPNRENQTFKMQLLWVYRLNQGLILIIVQVVKFKLKLECTKGPLNKVLLKGQSPTTSVSLLNIIAST